MCVSQYRDFVFASKFQVVYKSQNNYERDLKDKNIIVGITINYQDGQSVYYKTDLKVMRQLAKQGNEYAIEYFRNL